MGDGKWEMGDGGLGDWGILEWVPIWVPRQLAKSRVLNPPPFR